MNDVNDQNPQDNPPAEPDLHDPRVKAALRRYWKKNVIITVILLSIWGIAGLGCGIVFADDLNSMNLPGTNYPLGFWFAQQGSIIIFVFIILFYCLFMNMLDRQHHKELEAIQEGR